MTASERRSARLVVASFWIVSVFWTGSAWGEPTAGEKADARAWMAEGRSLRSQRNLEGALKSFKAADGIMHVPTTGFEVARTLEAMGRLVEARSAARRVLSIPVAPTDPAPYRDAVAAATSLYADLEQRIPAVTFVIQTGAAQGTPSVSVDGQALSSSDLGTPLRLDPGPHHIAAHLGQLDATQSIDLREHERQPVVIKMAGGSAKGSTTASPGGESAWRTVAYVSFGTSAVGLVVGTISGALALSTKHTAEAGCIDGQCPPATWEAIDRAHSYATVSTVGFATFGAGLGLGFASLALAPTRDSGSSGSSVRVRPRVGLGYAEIVGTF